VNLAAALSARGLKVGLCDCDLYGPSVALMCGAKERPAADEEGRIIPVELHGIKIMSMGCCWRMIPGGAPWTDGDTLHAAVPAQCSLGDLDVLILDLPPGTGDIQLTVVQTIPLTAR